MSLIILSDSEELPKITNDFNEAEEWYIQYEEEEQVQSPLKKIKNLHQDEVQSTLTKVNTRQEDEVQSPTKKMKPDVSCPKELNHNQDGQVLTDYQNAELTQLLHKLLQNLERYAKRKALLNASVSNIMIINVATESLEKKLRELLKPSDDV